MRSWLFLAGALAVGCSDGATDGLVDATPGDASPALDAGGSGDLDADTADVDEADTAPACFPIPWRDANEEGHRFGRDEEDVDGDTALGDDTPLATPCPAGTASRVVGYRYTLERDARIQVEVTSPSGGTLGVPMATWLQESCADTAGPSLLGCALGSRPATTSRRFDAGTTVYVFVGVEAEGLPTTPYRLQLNEIDARTPVGRPCVAFERCVEGADCTSERFCRARGAEGGLCRTTGARCDPGLGCRRNGECASLAGPDAPCDPADNLCGDGYTCPTGIARCVATGAGGGPCRAEGAASRCNAGFVCVEDRFGSSCVAALAEGASCETTARPERCTAGTICSYDERSGAHCIRDGQRGGACRAAPVAACDAPLACTPGGYCAPLVGPDEDCMGGWACPTGYFCTFQADGQYRCRIGGSLHTPCVEGSTTCQAGLACAVRRCVPVVAVGASCETEFMNSVCVAGSSCRYGRCTADGARDGRCRASAPACDAGLACDDRGFCLRAVAEGESCAGDVLCAAGTDCLTVGFGPRICTRPGAIGGRCRTGGAACDAGLSCDARTSDARCVRAVGLGETCGPAYVQCPAGAACRSVSGASVCVADGARWGNCRSGAGVRRCDVGLGCLVGSLRDTCVTEVAAGGACAYGSTTSICVEGAACLSYAGGPQRCRVEGALAGYCRTGRVCDAGLVCLPEGMLCARLIAVDESCEADLDAPATCGDRATCLARRGSFYCVAQGEPGATCRSSSPACSGTSVCSTGNLCSVAEGVDGGRCRASGVACDAGLACTPDRVCRRAAAEGEVCDLFSARVACVAGTSCRVAGTVYRCQR